MPDASGKLTEADIPRLNAHFARHTPDGSLTCPVTGQRVRIADWRVSDRLCMMPMSGSHLTVDIHQHTRWCAALHLQEE